MFSWNILGSYHGYIVGRNYVECMARISVAWFVFHPSVWDHFSGEAQFFVRQLLRVDPNERLTASSSLRDHWFSGTPHIERNVLWPLHPGHSCWLLTGTIPYSNYYTILINILLSLSLALSLPLHPTLPLTITCIFSLKLTLTPAWIILV